MTKRPVAIMHAKSLRKNMTDTEKRLWYRINRNQLGVKFRRQQPIGPYFVDFVCYSLKLIIEVDGIQHLDNVEYDNVRTAYLESAGYNVIRIPNSYLEYPILDEVIHTLYRCIHEDLDYYEYFVSRYK